MHLILAECSEEDRRNQIPSLAASWVGHFLTDGLLCLTENCAESNHLWLMGDPFITILDGRVAMPQRSKADNDNLPILSAPHNEGLDEAQDAAVALLVLMMFGLALPYILGG